MPSWSKLGLNSDSWESYFITSGRLHNAFAAKNRRPGHGIKHKMVLTALFRCQQTVETAKYRKKYRRLRCIVERIGRGHGGRLLRHCIHHHCSRPDCRTVLLLRCQNTFSQKRGRPKQRSTAKMKRFQAWAFDLVPSSILNRLWGIVIPKQLDQCTAADTFFC